MRHRLANGSPGYDPSMTRTTGRRREPPATIDLPPLAAFGGGRLVPRADHDAVDFADLDLGGHDATGATFLGCRIVRCELDGTVLARARLAECLLDDVRAVDLDTADGAWRDTLVTGARFGAVRAAGATWDDVRLRDSRANLLDLRGAHLANVTLEGCVIDELDLGGAEAANLRLEGCDIGRLVTDGAHLSDTDVAGSRIAAVQGIDGLRGVTLGTAQLLELGPQLAAFLAIRVR
jgi:uncharacterized protein YjbI with pentapeptide repeats